MIISCFLQNQFNSRNVALLHCKLPTVCVSAEIKALPPFAIWKHTPQPCSQTNKSLMFNRKDSQATTPHQAFSCNSDKIFTGMFLFYWILVKSFVPFKHFTSWIVGTLSGRNSIMIILVYIFIIIMYTIHWYAEVLCFVKFCLFFQGEQINR